ncbi:hypothetical protein [Streptomyces sp. NPDC055060]
MVDWTLTEVKLGQARLHRNGRDADPILVLTASVLEHYGLRLPWRMRSGVRAGPRADSRA